jgi:hypothetical protein
VTVKGFFGAPGWIPPAITPVVRSHRRAADDKPTMQVAANGIVGRIDRDHVARLMEAIAGGHQWAIWDLRDVADTPIRSRLRAELRRLDVPYDADDLDGMVIDAVLEIAKVAGAWQPGGASPWSWAHHRVIAVVHRFVGVFARSLEQIGETADVAENGRNTTTPQDLAIAPRQALQRLAKSRPRACDLDAALSELVSPRDAAVWLAVEFERAGGNRHPAVTVGAGFGMTDVGVRKVVQRVRTRLAQAAIDGRYPALRRVPVLAGHVSAAA